MKANPLAALDAIPREQLPAALARIAARLLEPPPPPTDDRWLSPDEVARRFSVHRKWVYRHADQLGGQRLGERTLRFPEEGLARRIAAIAKP